MTYRLTESDAVVRVADGATIPNDPENIDRAAYDEWVAKGGIPGSAPQTHAMNAPPASVTPLQARRALRAAGMLAGVNAYLATRSDEEREAWEYCIEVRRDDAMIVGAGAALGVSVAQMDDMFRLAATL